MPRVYSTRYAVLLVLGFALPLTVAAASADQNTTQVPMREKGSATFYVQANIRGAGDTELLVDTGSGYVTINESTLSALKHAGTARYLRTLQGVMADGREKAVPIYAISGLNIGGNCALGEVEVAVFTGTKRQILGLSGLRKVAPFVVSVDPPSLALSNCGSGVPGMAAEARVQLSTAD